MRIDRDREIALELLEKYYKGPVKYAKAVLNKWPYSDALVAYEGGPIGVEIFYKIPSVDTCVHYYIAVAPDYRKRGVATLLVKNVESTCATSTYLATTRESNIAAMRLFRNLGYTPHRWYDIRRGQRETLLKITCGYDDDLVFIKGLRHIERDREVEKLWRDTCLNPYLGHES